MEIYLLRHGQTESNISKRIQGQSDSPLTTLGTRQAHKLGERLSNITFTNLLTSPLGRARSTAYILAQYTGLEPQSIDSFKEISFGRVEGLTWHDVQEQHPEVCKKWRDHHHGISLPGGETRCSAVARVRRALSIYSEDEDKRIAVVTHGGVLAALFSDILNIPSGQRPLCMIENTSINIVRVKDGIWKIKTWGDTSHL